MEVGFIFWPFNPDLTVRLAKAAERNRYDMVGVADTPGNAMDPWIGATLIADHTVRPEVALCVTNLLSRHPAATAAEIASLDAVSRGRAVLGAGNSGTAALGSAASNYPASHSG